MGKSGVAVVRVSGPKSRAVLQEISGRSSLPQPRRATLSNFIDPASKDVLDRGLVLWFPGPHSFTGEDSCELHAHGSVAVVSALLRALSSLEGVRAADPGEFTRRAFYSGKLNLTQVEGLADLINAETEAQRKQAFLHSSDALGKVYERWRLELKQAAAHLEAYIDFGEAELLELDAEQLSGVVQRVHGLCADIGAYLDDGRRGEVLRQGVRAAVVGKPNAGKSSLFNLLCGRQAAIVSSTAGTTRDVISSTLDVAGYPLVLSDTAGIRPSSSDGVEMEGIRRARREMSAAAFALHVLDCEDFCRWREAHPASAVRDYVRRCAEDIGLEDATASVAVFNKADLLTGPQERALAGQLDGGMLLVSCASRAGLEDLLHRLAGVLEDKCGSPSEEHPVLSSVRHRTRLEKCLQYMYRFLEQAERDGGADVVIAAQYLRSALSQLGKLTGKVSAEELLDVIFRDFCIGK